MKRIVWVLGLVALAAAGACDETAVAPELEGPALSADAPSQAVVWNDRYVDRVEIAGSHWVPCANDGAGEEVVFYGSLLITEQWLVTDGRYSYRFQIQPQNLVGYGEVTGQAYRDAGGMREHYAGGDVGGTLIDVDEAYRMITRGSDDNFFYRFRVRIQYTPGGEPVVDRVGEDIECR